MNKHSFTVGIPFYIKTNPQYFDMAIKSIINQTILPNKVHLIQDGAINDNLCKIIDKYIKRYPKLIELIELPKKGLPYALNRSIQICKTKYYARMDSDDISDQDRFKVQLDYLDKNPKIEILGSWAIEFEKNHLANDSYIHKTPNDIVKIKKYLHYRNPLIHPSVIFKTNVFKKIGLYNEKFLTDQDLELWCRAIKKDIKISNIQSPLIYLRIEGRHQRRSKISAIKRQVFIRYSYNSSSFKLNVLKLAAIILRILPLKIREWSYRNLRSF